ncbi:MAG: Coat F domain protein [Desulfotomaculum sp. 46_296]|nr:MAG: Coat F domain protein [Desulfotomaculum sp. 46_296]HAU32619.1 hypothetical protein [Desulfotomaculum sp.]
MEFTDRDILTDILTGAKTISTGYHTAVLESANDRVRGTLIQINNEELNIQKKIFDLMHSRGWYPLDPVFTGVPMGAETTGIRSEIGSMRSVSAYPGGSMGIAPGMSPGPIGRSW